MKTDLLLTPYPTHLDRLVGRDNNLLEELVRENSHILMSDLLRITRRQDLAEDLFQETWLHAIRNSSQFRGRSSFRAWLRAIARNSATDMFRKLSWRWDSRCAPHEEDAEWQDKLISKSASSLDAVLDNEKQDHMMRLLNELPRHYREVLFLHFYRDLTLEEIAVETGKNISTIKARLYRGLKQARQHLTSYQA